MRANRYAAVVFDMDGTLLDTERLAASAWPAAATALGLPFDPDLPLAMVGHDSASCRQMIIARHGAAYPVDALVAAVQQTYDVLTEREGIALMPGALQIVQFLAGLAVPLAVATSTRRARATAKLDHAGLLKYFPALVGGDEVAHGKPAPDIYVAAAARLGVEARDCLAIEDSGTGFRAAHAACMDVVLVPDIVDARVALQALAPRVLPNLAAVQAWLACDNSPS